MPPKARPHAPKPKPKKSLEALKAQNELAKSDPSEDEKISIFHPSQQDSKQLFQTNRFRVSIRDLENEVERLQKENGDFLRQQQEIMLFGDELAKLNTAMIALNEQFQKLKMPRQPSTLKKEEGAEGLEEA